MAEIAFPEPFAFGNVLYSVQEVFALPGANLVKTLSLPAC
jgi:hypothetical protein